MKHLLLSTALLLSLGAAAEADTTTTSVYWNLFNFELEDITPAGYATYGSLTDMLGDTNRTGFYSPDGQGFARDAVGTDSDGKTFWNLFNFELEDTTPAGYVTYGTLADMLGDTNRTGFYSPDGHGFARDVVETGSDGKAYWNLFNFELEDITPAGYATYATLLDMLGDTNRTGFYSPDALGFARDVVGTGSDGTTYWNLFNFELEDITPAGYATYATLLDMLGDTNRTGFFSPDALGFARDVVGTGAYSITTDIPSPVPLPGSFWLLLSGALSLTGLMRRRPGIRSGS